jgi:hypothetical protein
MKPTQHMLIEDDVPQSKPRKTKTVVTEDTATAPIAANILDLPSKGQFGYPAQVQYRDILAKDEEILASTTADTYARTLNGVVKSILMNCDFFEQMCVHDRDYALIWLWSNNYTPRKQVDVQCPHCENHDTVTVDMTDLEVTEPEDGFTGSVEMTLKLTGKPVKIRMRTVGDEIAVESFLAANTKTAYSYDHLMLVRALDLGLEIPLAQKAKWVGENVTGREMAIIKKFHDHFAYGTKTKIHHSCTACGGSADFDLPFQGADVFNPQLSDDFEELLRSM